MPNEDLIHDKEKAEEARFKLRQELRFKAQSRRNKLLGLWAAEEMGMDEERAGKYAQEVIMADFEEPGEDDVVRKLLKDFELRDVAIDEETIVEIMERLMEVAYQQVEKEYPTALGPDHERVGDVGD